MKYANLSKKLYSVGLGLVMTVSLVMGQTAPHPDQVYPIPNNYGDVNGADINLLTGDVNFTTTLAAISGHLLNYDIQAFYNSRSASLNTKNGNSVPNALGGWGWKLMDYPKIVQDGSSYYMLDGHASYPLRQTGPPNNYTTGNIYYLWQFSYDSNENSWKLTDEDGAVFTLGNTSQANTYNFWNLSTMSNPNWPDTLAFTYQKASLTGISNTLNDELELLYDQQGLLTAIKVYQNKAHDSQEQQLLRRVDLDYSQQSGDTLLSKVEVLKTLQNDRFVDGFPPLVFEYFDNEARYPLAVRSIHTPSGSVQLYGYTGTKHEKLPNVVVYYAVNSGYDIAKDDHEKKDSERVYSAIGYTPGNSTTDTTGIYQQYNQVRVYPGGFYIDNEGNLDPSNIHGPYGHDVYYFFNGVVKDSLLELPGDYPSIDVQSPAVRGVAYLSKSFSDYDETIPRNLVSSGTTYWAIDQINGGSIATVLKDVSTVDSVDYTTQYKYNADYLPVTVLSTQRNPKLDGGDTIHEDSVKATVRYAYQDYPALKTLNILTAKSQTANWVKEFNQKRWEVTSSSATHWTNVWKGGGAGWAPKQTYILQDEIDPANLLSGLSENPPENLWLKTGEIIGRNRYGATTLSSNIDSVLSTTIYDSLFQLYPIASFNNTNSYAGEAGYYGCEAYEPAAQWKLSGGNIVRNNAHTGHKSYASNGSNLLTVMPASYQPRTDGSTDNYVVSAFVKLNPGGTCSYGFYNGTAWQGDSLQYNSAEKGWQYVQFIHPSDPSYVPTIQCTDCMVDDIRFSPLDAPFSATVYYDNRVENDSITINTGDTGVYEANYVITVADSFSLASGESLTLLAGEKISFGSDTSIAPGAHLTTQLLEGLYLDMNRVTATLAANGETERTVYNAFDVPIAVVGPSEQARSLTLSYNSRGGNYIFNDTSVFDPDYPNMQLDISAREGGGWEGFQFADNPNFPPGNLGNMYVLDEALFTGTGAGPDNEATATLAAAITASSYVLYAEVAPENLSPEEEIGMALGSGPNEIRLVLNGNGFQLYQPSDSLDETIKLSHIPSASGLTIIVLDTLHLFAYVDGRFLFDYTLPAPVNDSVKLVSSDPRGSFNNFIYLEDPIVSLNTYDATGQPRQSQVQYSPTEISIQQQLYGGDLHLPMAMTRNAISSSSEGVLAYQPNFATLDLSGSEDQLQVTPGSEVYTAYNDPQPFVNSVAYHSDPSLRNASSGSGGSSTAGNSDAPDYSYHDNDEDYFDFEAQELQQTTVNAPLSYESDVQSYTYSGAETGAVFGRVHADSASGTNLQQQLVYDKKMRLSEHYYPNFFDDELEGAEKFFIQEGYNFLGNLMMEITPDHGKAQYGYDKAGRGRLLLDANGYAATTPYYLYTKYDNLGRVIENGLLPDTSINRTVTQAELTDGAVELAVGTLTAENATISSGETVTLQAGRKISFGTGFKIEPGATVRVKILNTALQDYNEDNLKDNDFPSSGQQAVNTYTYDLGTNAIGRLVTTRHYDPQGKLANTEHYSYTLGGEMDAVTLTVQNGDGRADSSRFSYQYDLIGAVTRIEQDHSNSSNDFNYQVTYAYDRMGQVVAIGNGSDPDYYASYAYGNGMFTETLNPESNAIARIYATTAESWTDSISDDLFKEKLYYQTRFNSDSGYVNGLVASAGYQFSFNNAPENYHYEYDYDGFGRLTKADASLTRASIDTATYDFDGNIVSLKENSTATGYSYYLGSNQLHTTSGGTSASFTYDANGNSQQAGTSSLTYFPFSNLTGQVTKGSTTVNFSYNTHLQRIRKVVNSDTLTYYHGLNDYPLLEITSDQGSDPAALAYVYGPTGLVAIQQQASGSTENYFVLKDHLGSTRVVTDSVRNVVAWFNYDPFGQLINSSDSGAVPVRYRYTGQEYDSETGLYNYRARLYNADLGRFYAPDPLQEQTSAYAYVGNNPISNVDPDGRKIIIENGQTAEQRLEILTYLQKLTDDMLFFRNLGDGTWEVWIREGNVGDKEAGTRLIKRLIDSRKTVAIYVGKAGSGNNNTRVNKKNAINGKGSDALVRFDPTKEVYTLTEEPGEDYLTEQKRSNQVGLAHELIHADRTMRGVSKDLKETEVWAYTNEKGKRVGTHAPKEELATIGLKYNTADDITENMIRMEQGENKRGAYAVVRPKKKKPWYKKAFNSFKKGLKKGLKNLAHNYYQTGP